MGIQVDEDSELAEVRERIKKADLKTFDEGETTCCYASADKTWVIDPAGVAWETYKVMGDVELFGKDREVQPEKKAQACCGPTKEKPKMALGEAVSAKKTSCC